MRGLKPDMLTDVTSPDVASFTDAWIETTLTTALTRPKPCRIFYRCVDWNLSILLRPIASISRIFYRCVDWNHGRRCSIWKNRVASFTDAWIETEIKRKVGLNGKSHLLQMRGLKQMWVIQQMFTCSRIFYRCVDWNKRPEDSLSTEMVASFTDAWIETFCLFMS